MARPNLLKLSPNAEAARATFQPDPERWGDRQPGGACTIASLSETCNGLFRATKTMKNRKKWHGERTRKELRTGKNREQNP